MLGIALAFANFRPPTPPPEPPDPERLLWPASRITKADMIRLTELREQTGEPITQLLHEAVCAYYQMLTEDEPSPDDNGQSHDPALVPQGKPAEEAHP